MALSLPTGNNIDYNKTINFELTGCQMTDQINETRDAICCGYHGATNDCHAWTF